MMSMWMNKLLSVNRNKMSPVDDTVNVNDPHTLCSIFLPVTFNHPHPRLLAWFITHE
jgi:hypothetical protein